MKLGEWGTYCGSCRNVSALISGRKVSQSNCLRMRVTNSLLVPGLSITSWLTEDISMLVLDAQS